ncbi:MAG: hypothetical protein HYR74_00750 [Candidatus Eisenbacteria bacterium]|nr:hypothetical protein [Candidatus Eisenbacteria bacterium]
MSDRPVVRIDPSDAMMVAARRWLEPVRAALGPDFVAAYLTGSVLAHGFDARHSSVNVLIVARELGLEQLDRLGLRIPEAKKPPHFDPLFLTQRQVERSLDVFPIEWVDIQERHLLVEGQDVLGALAVPRDNLRLQIEHDLRRTTIALRHAYLAHARHPDRLEGALRHAASGLATICRTLLRLEGEAPPAHASRVIERVAEVFGLEAEGLLAAHVVRYAEHRHRGADLLAHYRKFMVEVESLVTAIDEMRVP